MRYVAPLGAADKNAPYVDGSPEHGIEGSAVPAESIENPMREIVEVITQAGLIPNGEDTTQLWQALLEVIKVKVPLATLERPGLVMPDGGTCTVNDKGTLSTLPGGAWDEAITYKRPCMVLHGDKVFIWLAPSGPGQAGVGAKEPGITGSGVYWRDYAGVPKGMVAPFYNVTFGGSDGRRPIFWGEAVPDEGYVLCDGGSDGAGGTVPDLRERMILGAGASYTAGSTGGAMTHAHSVSGDSGAATLTLAEVPSHSHSCGIQSSYRSTEYNSGGVPHCDAGTSGSAGGSGSHSHSLSASTSSVNGLPPYYALAYLVKI